MQEMLAGCRTFSGTGFTYSVMGLFILCLLEDRTLASGALKVECFTPDGSSSPHRPGESSGESVQQHVWRVLLGLHYF